MLMLDHVGIVVSDLDRTATRFREWGFRLTRKAEHTRRVNRGAFVSAGSSQHSIMLNEGYLELVSVTDPTAGHPLAGAGLEAEGAVIIALGSPDAEATFHRLRRLGVAVNPPVRWQRFVDEPALRGLATFAFFTLPAEATPEGLVIVVEHLTPELIRPPDACQHANGATRLLGLVFWSDRPNETAERYAAWCGVTARRERGGWTIPLRDQQIVVRPRPMARPGPTEVREIVVEVARGEAAGTLALPGGRTLRLVSGFDA